MYTGQTHYYKINDRKNRLKIYSFTKYIGQQLLQINRKQKMKKKEKL